MYSNRRLRDLCIQEDVSAMTLKNCCRSSGWTLNSSVSSTLPMYLASLQTLLMVESGHKKQIPIILKLGFSLYTFSLTTISFSFKSSLSMFRTALLRLRLTGCT